MGDLTVDFERINKAREFRHLYNDAYRFVTDFFIVFFKKDNGSAKKIAVVASKKVGKAVHRNKAKRRMREILRLSKQYIKPGTSIILVARKPILNCNFRLLIETFQKLLEKFYTYEDNKQNS